jgi:hypothetical protein
MKLALVATGLVVAAGMLGAAPAAAQEGFFFRPPIATVEVRLGRYQSPASGDIYQHMTENFTLGRGDFAATSVSADASLRVLPSMDVVLGVGYAMSGAMSESREFVDQDDQPIIQRTQLTKIPVSVGARLYPLSRGESVGQYAWIPAAFVPYAGIGGGLMRYTLEQSGDFVNFADFSIFNDELVSKATAPMAYGEAGASYWVSARVGLSGGVRYTYAKAGMHDDYEGFEDIDLSGFQASAGFAVRF